MDRCLATKQIEGNEPTFNVQTKKVFFQFPKAEKKSTNSSNHSMIQWSIYDPLHMARILHLHIAPNIQSDQNGPTLFTFYIYPPI